MRNRHIAQIVLACLGIFVMLTFQRSPQLAQVLRSADPARGPVDSVEAFYKAVERGDWLRVRALTTRECWNRLEEQGQIQKWQDRRARDQSLEFAGFSVQNSQISENKAVIEGSAIWISAQGRVSRISQKVTLQQDLGGWRISGILIQQSSATADDF